MTLAMLPQDKANHVIAGVLVYVVVTALLAFFTALSAPVIALLGLLASAVAGVMKEVTDFIGNQCRRKAGLPPNHDVDPLDFAATLVGGLLVFAAAYMLVV